MSYSLSRKIIDSATADSVSIATLRDFKAYTVLYVSKFFIV